MGLFQTLGTIAGTILGGPGLGSTIGGAVGGALDSATSADSTQTTTQQPKTKQPQGKLDPVSIAIQYGLMGSGGADLPGLLG